MMSAQEKNKAEKNDRGLAVLGLGGGGQLHCFKLNGERKPQ